jgi:CBS domain containing-hemolysin-like protein
MTTLLFILAVAVALLLIPICFVQWLYIEALRLRAREQPALSFFKETLEGKLKLKLEEGALAFSLLKHVLMATLAILMFAAIEHGDPKLRVPAQPLWHSLIEAAILSSVVMLLVAHLLPQLFYRRTSGRWLMRLYPLLSLVALASRPLLGLLEFMRSLADLSSSEEPEEEKAATQSQEIEALITAGAEEGLIEEEDRKLIQSVVEFGDKTVRQVMTPRPNIVAISEDCTLEELHKLVVREQYSRVLTYRGSLDDVTGFVHVRDMMQMDSAERARRKVKEIRRDIIGVPETKPVDDLLRLMQREGVHIVLVVDEYGNTAGLATMEDLVEEIVGEISDEHDPNRDVAAQADGSYIVSGNFDLDHLAELFQFRPEADTESTTIGGLVAEWLGRVPQAGESVEHEGLRIEVLAADDRRVAQVRLARASTVEMDDRERQQA